jgi:hypothetical protein
MFSPAIFVSENVRLKSALTIDISTGGISLTVPYLMQVGQVCAVSFDVPGKLSQQRTLISGTVVSCVAKEEGGEGGEGYRVGIHYVESDRLSKQLIQAAVEHYLE